MYMFETVKKDGVPYSRLFSSALHNDNICVGPAKKLNPFEANKAKKYKSLTVYQNPTEYFIVFSSLRIFSTIAKLKIHI
jgi:hypothetical protein